MILLIGHDAPVRSSSVVAAVDLDGKITTPDTADFLRRAERSGITRLTGADLPKSAVICAPPRRRARRTKRKVRSEEVVFTTLSTAVILKRSARKRGGL